MVRLRLTILFRNALVADLWIAGALTILTILLTIRALFIDQIERLKYRERHGSSLHPLFASSGITWEVLD